MKTFSVALIVLVLLCGAVIWNNVYIKKVTSELLEHCDALPSRAEGGEAEEAAFKETAEKIKAVWDKARFWICLTVHHAEADAIEEALGELTVQYQAKDEGGYASAKRALGEKIRELRRSESFSLEGIL